VTSALQFLLRRPLLVAATCVVFTAAFLIGRADMAYFGPPPSFSADVKHVPLLPSGLLQPASPIAGEHRAAYVIRLHNRGAVVVDSIDVVVSDAEVAYRQRQGVFDSLAGSGGRFRVGSVGANEEVVVWAIPAPTSAQDRSRAAQVFAGTRQVPMSVYFPFPNDALALILHLSQILIGLFAVEALAIIAVDRLVRSLAWTS
jgi:hypothetical protein